MLAVCMSFLGVTTRAAHWTLPQFVHLHIISFTESVTILAIGAT